MVVMVRVGNVGERGGRRVVLLLIEASRWMGEGEDGEELLQRASSWF